MTVRFGSRVALDDVTLELHPAHSVALIGPNGSGKTTLLRVLAGLQTPTSGDLVRQGALDDRAPIAFVTQHQHQHQWMPLAASDVVTMGRFQQRGLLGRLTSTDREICENAAHRLGVVDLLNRRFGDLSGGQRQRILLASALANEPKVLLLDEPLTGLDPPSIETIANVIDAECQGGALVVSSTHHLDDARRSDRVVLLNKEVVAEGPPEDVLVPDKLAMLYGQSVTGDVLIVDDHGHGDHGHDHIDHGRGDHGHGHGDLASEPQHNTTR